MKTLEQDELEDNKERTDFFDQVAFLLERKDKVGNISLSNRKIQELMRNIEHM